LRASLIQTLYSIRSERQLVQHLDFNLLLPPVPGLDMDDLVWDHSVFSKNRDRLLNEAVARSFFGKVLALAEWQGLVSCDHFTVDGTLIEAWASLKSFVPKDSGHAAAGRGQESDGGFQGRAAQQRHALLEHRPAGVAVQEGRRGEIPAVLSGSRPDGEP
jgi:hypothetical protein